jgi:hypothetical protein
MISWPGNDKIGGRRQKKTITVISGGASYTLIEDIVPRKLELRPTANLKQCLRSFFTGMTHSEEGIRMESLIRISAFRS